MPCCIWKWVYLGFRTVEMVNMRTRNFLFFINPISGTANKAALLEFIETSMRAEQLNYAIEHTNANGNYSYLPSKIKEEQITDVVICGGDGSINQVGNYLVGINVRIGIIPRGSGNGLAFSLGIPKNKEKALKIILDGYAAKIDAFQINDRFSCMLCGLGFDAKVAHEFAKASSRGLKTYTKLTLSNWVFAKSYRFSIFSEGQLLLTEAYFINIANANQFGNNIRIAPKASLSDGKLDIIIVNKMNRIRLLGHVLRQLLAGNPVTIKEARKKKKAVQYIQTSSLKIVNDMMAPLHIDGEPAETAKEFDIRVIPLALNLVQPRS